jgi:hypothetical protein
MTPQSKTRNFYQDYNRYRRCPENILVAALQNHFGDAYESHEWVDDALNQKRSVDLLVRLKNGSRVPVELKQSKRRPKSLEECELPLETWSSLESCQRGPLLAGGKAPRYMLFLYANGKSLMLAFRTLAAVIRRLEAQWLRKYFVFRQANKGRWGTLYTSECVFVPFREIRKRMRAHLKGFGIAYEPSLAT